MRSVTCPDCGAQVELPTVSVGDESVTVNCQNCLWQDLDSVYKTRRGLEIWSGGGSVAEMACWTCVPPGPGLQTAINAAGTGGRLMLQPGTYSGDITLPSNMVICGAGRDVTILTGKVLVEGNQNSLDNLWVMATGKAYGVKIFKFNTGPNRNEFREVRIGGTTNSSDGPAGPGLWLDGAILNVFDHCTIAFNGGDGIYVNTSDIVAPIASTNVNTFRDCTVNLNDGWGLKTETGVDITAGMQQHVFLGGNFEDNAHGVAFIGNSFYTRFDNVDMESSIDLGTTFDVTNKFGGWLINGDTATYIIIENCAINSTGNTGRLFVFSSCGSCQVNNNRIIGQFPLMDVGVFDEGCYRCTASGNAWWDPTIASGSDQVTPRWINNRGQNRGWTG